VAGIAMNGTDRRDHCILHCYCFISIILLSLPSIWKHHQLLILLKTHSVPYFSGLLSRTDSPVPYQSQDGQSVPVLEQANVCRSSTDSRSLHAPQSKRCELGLVIQQRGFGNSIADQNSLRRMSFQSWYRLHSKSFIAPAAGQRPDLCRNQGHRQARSRRRGSS
jgi:hypothetical protein